MGCFLSTSRKEFDAPQSCTFQMRSTTTKKDNAAFDADPKHANFRQVGPIMTENITNPKIRI